MTNFEQQLAVTVHLIKTWKDHKRAVWFERKGEEEK